MEIPLYKEYRVQKHTHKAKINSSFINLLYTICLLISTDLKWDNVQRELNVKLGNAEYTGDIGRWTGRSSWQLPCCHIADELVETNIFGGPI